MDTMIYTNSRNEIILVQNSSNTIVSYIVEKEDVGYINIIIE
jgi:hypothetical protein